MSKQTKIVQIDDDEQVERLPVRPDDEPDDVALSNVIADLGGAIDAKVNVYRLEGPKGSSFVGSFDPASFSIEEIQASYGPGEYKVHVRKDGRLVANRIVRVAAPKHSQFAATSAPAQEIGRIAEAMQTGFQSMAQMIAQSMQTLAQTIAQSQNNQKTTEQMLREMALMKEILGGSQPQRDPFELFQKGIEFAKDLIPREGEVSPSEIVLEALKTFGKPIAEAVTAKNPLAEMQAQMAGLANPAPQILPQIPVQTSAPESAPASAEPQNVNVGDNQMIKYYLKLLAQLAAEDRDPGLYAELIIDQAPEVVIKDVLSKPDPATYLASMEPSLVPHLEWLKLLIEEVKALTTESPDASVEGKDS